MASNKDALQRYSNIATIILCVLILGTLVFRISSIATPHSNRQSLSLPNVKWQGYTLVMFLSTKCHYCTDSADFYRSLSSHSSQYPAVHLMAAFPQSEEEARHHLKSLNIEIADVRKVDFENVGITGTPTLLLVNESGRVIRSWVGKLPEAKEKDLLTVLGSAS